MNDELQPVDFAGTLVWPEGMWITQSEHLTYNSRRVCQVRVVSM